MTTLVTGAGGFLGRALVRRLLHAGHRVRALVRRGSPHREVPDGAEPVEGDVTPSEDLARAAAGCDVVYHLAGVRRSPDAATFMRVNVEGTRLLLDACVAAGAARRRFVLAGSLAAAGPSATGRTEDDPPAPAEAYGASKAEAERVARAYAGRLPVTIGRPPRILGPGDRENLVFFRLAARRVLLAIGGPERPLSWVDVDDCARGFELLGTHPAAVGESFFLASGERTSIEGLQREVARALGVRPLRLPVPPLLLATAGWIADGISTASGRKLPLNRKLARQVLAAGWTCSPAKAERVLGFRAGTALSDSVGRSARFYRAAGWL